MSESIIENQSKIKKLVVPIVVGALTLIAVISAGIWIRSQLSSQDGVKTVDNLVRDFNPVIGKKDSRVKFVYLYDYMCPACQSNADNMVKLKQEYSDKIAFVYKPFIVHPGSGDRMTYASYAALKQGKFDDFNSKLIKQTPDYPTAGLSVSQLENLAKQTGLDSIAFTKDYNSIEIEKQVKIDQKDIRDTVITPSRYTKETKVSATPTIVLLKDNKLTDHWWSGVISLEDGKDREGKDQKGVKSRINDLLAETK